MKIISIRKILLTLLLLIFTSSFLFARALDDGGADKKFDEKKVHRVGNIWLRVSNYGFFGSGNTSPQWPSLEYPGGSSIDYLYQGALWFGAKKVRRNSVGQKLYWKPNPVDQNDCIPATHQDWTPSLKLVVDTLTTVGFDGDLSLYEFLPAYNPLEAATMGQIYNVNNPMDTIMSASIRTQRRAIDDDGDGKIDEDPIGYSFPFRKSNELPAAFYDYGSLYPHDFLDYSTIDANIDIWFPLGFVDLSDTSKSDYLFTAPHDDDNDGLNDEDGAPVSEQDFISYYYDYSPFPNGYSGDRDWGQSSGSSRHYPLNVRVRQLSYQWSYDYIKNLVYVEFNVTNMNSQDTLYDCAMGIYMDCDIGPQAWSPEQRANDDLSGYVTGEGFEFAYSEDADKDGGLTPGMIGARVCTPDPEQLEYACWYWNVGQGPDDGNPLNLSPTGPTANQKYWLITGRNPDTAKYTDLKAQNQTVPGDTRFLFGFYGDMNGFDAPTESSWNLAPGKTMKIVVAVFPGDNLQDLKNTSLFAKAIYGQAQTLTTVTQPDIFPHYQAFEPPPIPTMYGEMLDEGKRIDICWDNRSEIENYDSQIIGTEQVGWQTFEPQLDSYVNSMTNPDLSYLTINGEMMPQQYWPQNYTTENHNALVNPWTAYRLRHDFQGYALYGRSGSGSQEHWQHKDRWDRIETLRDLADYNVNSGSVTPDGETYFIDLGGDLGIDKGLPNPQVIQDGSPLINYYRFNEFYQFVNYQTGDTFYGYPIYNHAVVWSQELYNQAANLTKTDAALLFKHPDMKANVYLTLYDEKHIPLPGFFGQSVYYDENGVFSPIPDAEKLEIQRVDRLTRRYYKSSISNPPRGIEYYVAVTSWDRGMPSKNLAALESGRDADANMRIFFPGPSAKSNMNNIFVTPNPYIGPGKFDGLKENDDKGDKSRRIWFANLPEKCTIRIYTLAGDLVQTLHHDGLNNYEDIISVSKAAYAGLASSGIKSWNLLSRYNQIIAPGVYLYSVEDKDGNLKVDKFVIIK